MLEYNFYFKKAGCYMHEKDKYRIEKDSLGEVLVEKDKLWGAQTQRSLNNFRIGTEKIPEEVIKALLSIKKSCAQANFSIGKLDKRRYLLIENAVDEALNSEIREHFPLAVWQTGSGTQSNMNVNEVVARISNNHEGIQGFVHPNDHVNMSQSSNDVFPSAMKIAALMEIETKLLPAANKLADTLKNLEDENKGIVKVGRTHLQDAVPIAFSQEISGWRGMIENPVKYINDNLYLLREIALGATAVGTGLNSPKGFDEIVSKFLSENLKTRIVPEKNKFHSLTSMDAFVFMHGALKSLASNLMKIANDIRLLSSGPRCGIGEITIPQNEPGSSIMPGKVNPTQCEAVTMIAVQVIANDVAVGMAASQGNFQLNVFMPVCIYNFIQSVRLLSDGMISFEKNCVRGIKPVKEKMENNLNRNLMSVTALNSVIGYDKSSKIAQKAYREDISLKQAALELGFLNEDQIDKILNPYDMI